MITAKQTSEEMNLIPYKCHHCKGVLGLTTNAKLFIGAARFIKHVTFQCGYCEKTTFWKPDNEKIGKIK